MKGPLEIATEPKAPYLEESLNVKQQGEDDLQDKRSKVNKMVAALKTNKCLHALIVAYGWMFPREAEMVSE